MGREQRGAEPPKRLARLAADPGARRRLRAAELAGVSLRVFDGWAPTQTHQHYDADGVLTGTTVVTTEPEFNDRLRAEYLTAAALKANTCPRCGNFDTLIEVPAGRRTLTFTDGGQEREVDVRQYRCITCAASQHVERVFTDAHRKDERSLAKVSPADGQQFIAAPMSGDG